MRVDKDKAIELRKTGKSYKEIKLSLGVPMSTLSDWLSDMKWSKEIVLELRKKSAVKSTLRIIELNKIRGKNLSLLYKEARDEALKDFEILKYNPLFIAAVSIYWGEGDKSSKNGFRIANIDARMLKLFVSFLVDICRVDKSRIKAWVLLYPDLNEDICKKYWKENIGLRDANFTKSIIITGREKIKRVSNGVCYVGFSSRYLKEKMLVWIELLSKLRV